MAAARQIPLDLPWPRHERAGRADFIVSESNAGALGFVDAWRDWQDGRLALVGPEGAGKTHLALIWASESGAVFVDAGTLHEMDIRALAAQRCIVIDDCDRQLKGEATERALFHLLNVTGEQGGRILLTGRTPPSRWTIALADLASRLAAATVATVNAPDDALLMRLVTKLFTDRDILVEERVSAYIASRIDRNFVAAQTAVAALDAEALESGKPISTPMARKLFKW